MPGSLKQGEERNSGSVGCLEDTVKSIRDFSLRARVRLDAGDFLTHVPGEVECCCVATRERPCFCMLSTLPTHSGCSGTLSGSSCWQEGSFSRCPCTMALEAGKVLGDSAVTDVTVPECLEITKVAVGFRFMHQSLTFIFSQLRL